MASICGPEVEHAQIEHMNQQIFNSTKTKLTYRQQKCHIKNYHDARKINIVYKF